MKPIKLVALHQSIELDIPPHFFNPWRNVEWTGQNCSKSDHALEENKQN